jgi:hypothetical protein
MKLKIQVSEKGFHLLNEIESLFRAIIIRLFLFLVIK